MPTSKAHMRAVAKYERANYDKIMVRLRKGEGDVTRAAAAERGESLNAFIANAIRQHIQSPAANGAGRADQTPPGEAAYSKLSQSKQNMWDLIMAQPDKTLTVREMAKAIGLEENKSTVGEVMKTMKGCGAM